MTVNPNESNPGGMRRRPDIQMQAAEYLTGYDRFRTEK